MIQKMFLPNAGVRGYDVPVDDVPQSSEWMRARHITLEIVAFLGGALAFAPMGAAVAQSESAKLIAGDATAGQLFGYAVAMDGDTVVVGARGDEHAGDFSGAAYVFRRDATGWTAEGKLTAYDSAAGHNFGYSVAISGDRVVVGARGDDHAGSLSGSAYVFERSRGVWRMPTKIVAGDASAGHLFGESVAIHGDRIVVGARGDGHAGRLSGSAYVFRRTSDSWVQEAKLTAVDASPNDWFGVSVALGEGHAVVGAHLAGGTGAAYVFRRVGTRWFQDVRLGAYDAGLGDLFGYAVSIDGDRVLVGAYSDNDAGAGSGSAYLFQRGKLAWTQEAKLVASDGAPGDQFGYSVSIKGSYAVVGAAGADGSGTAHVFKRHASEWVAEQELSPTDSTAGGFFGHAVAAGADSVLVGARADNHRGDFAGAAYVFDRTEDGWMQEPKITAASPSADSWFGASIALSGDHLLVGAHLDSEDAEHSGSAHVYKRNSMNWAPTARLRPRAAAAGDFFGCSVGVNEAYAVVGAYGDDEAGDGAGSAYVFRRRGERWIEELKLLASDASAGDRFGVAVGIGDERALIGASSNNDAGRGSGSAYVFRRHGRRWIEEAKLTASDAHAGDTFGHAVSIAPEFCVVGAPHHDPNGRRAGAAYVFRLVGSRWIEDAKLAPRHPTGGDLFGYSVSVSGPFILVGAYGDRDAGFAAGAAYVFKRTDAGWVQQAKLIAEDVSAGDLLGYSVSIAGDRAVLGAHRNSAASQQSGAAYMFQRFGDTWMEQVKLTPRDAKDNQLFGWSVAADAGHVAIGAHFDDHAGLRSGASYVFRYFPGSWSSPRQPDHIHARSSPVSSRVGQ